MNNLSRLLTLALVGSALIGSALAKEKGSSPSKRTQKVDGYTTKAGKHVDGYKRAPKGASDAPKKARKGK